MLNIGNAQSTNNTEFKKKKNREEPREFDGANPAKSKKWKRKTKTNKGLVVKYLQISFKVTN